MKSNIYTIYLLIPIVSLVVVACRGNVQKNAHNLSVVETSLPVETMPVAETQTEGKQMPTALPIVTAKEAQKLNDEAIAYALTEKEKREPFYELYHNSELESVCFQGTIRATSAIPDPETNDYDNCLYALLVELDSFFADKEESNKEEMPYEVIIAVPIMKEKVINKSNIFEPGDKIICTCAEYDTMPQEIQEIQLSDDILSYEHQQYYTFEINRINSFSKEGNRHFAKRKISLLPIQPLPKDENAAALRKKRIQDEISRIEEEIQKHGGSFEKWKEEYKSIEQTYKKKCEEGYEGWINDSFFSAGGSESTYKTKEYIEGITPYKQYLEKNNIDLIVVRFPSKWDFAARVLASEDFQENPAWVEHYYECLKNDIEIVDPMPEMWKHRFDYTEFYFFQVPEEIHPYNGYAFVTAQVLASCLERYSFKNEKQSYLLKNVVFPSPSPKYYYPKGNSKFDSNSPMALQSIYKDGSRLRCTDYSSSPFLVFSNSLFTYPSTWIGAGFPEYLAYHAGITPDFIYQQGQQNSMLRTLVSNPTILSNRRAAIMPGGYFMWHGFPPFPKYFFDNPKSISLEKTLVLRENNGVIKDLAFSCSETFNLSNIEGGGVNFEFNSKYARFSLAYTIPYILDKKVCMVRIIFKEYNKTTITARDAQDNSIIEPESEADGYLKRCDLFIPIQDKPRDIKLDCRIHGSNFTQIEKIELWYY